jgi:hypothetical protein
MPPSVTLKIEGGGGDGFSTIGGGAAHAPSAPRTIHRDIVSLYVARTAAARVASARD